MLFKKVLIVLSALVCSTLASAEIKNPTLPENLEVLEPSSLLSQFSKASSAERKYLKELIVASKGLRRVLIFQTHRHALTMHGLFFEAFSPGNLEKTKSFFSADQFQELVKYALFFQDNAGPYDTYKNEKFYLVGSNAAIVEKWLGAFATTEQQRAELKEIARMMTDPKFEVNEYLLDPNGTGLEHTGGNLYDKGITAEEVREAVKGGSLKLALNARVVRGKDGKLALQLIALDNTELDPRVREALREAILHLEKARRIATTDAQANQIRYLVDYLKTGNAESARWMTHHFIHDPKAKTRLYIDYIFPMYDFMGVLSKLDMTLLGVDSDQTKVLERLAKRAQYFEDKLPFGEFKKKFPSNYAPGISMLYGLYRAGMRENPGMHFDDPFDPLKSINLIPYTPEMEGNKVWLDSLRKKFAAFITAREVEPTVSGYHKGTQTLLMLHELLGHGSGTVDPAKYPGGEDPYTAMGVVGMSLEEKRANLVSFYEFEDPALVEDGVFRDWKEARALLTAWLYQNIAYTANMVARGESIQWPHMRAAFFLINYWIDRGVVVVSQQQKGEPLFKIKDVGKLLEVSATLLAEVQSIRANRQEDKLKENYGNKYAPLDVSKVEWVKLFEKRAKALPTDPSFLFQPFTFKGCEVLLIGNLKDPSSFVYAF